MVQQSIDSKLSEYGLGNNKMDLPNRDKQVPPPVKKTALRDLQNDNKIMVPTSIGSSSFLKDKSPNADSNRVSGTKRPTSEYAVSHHLHQSPGNNAANGHLVYVRRKSEAELGKSSAGDNVSINVYPHSRQLGEDETGRQNPLIKERNVSCFPAFSPFPMTSSISSTGKPSVPLPPGKSALRLAPVDSNYVSASSSPTIGNPRGLKNVPWEERYHRLQMLLRKLDQSDNEDYIQMLWSLSSTELSRQAVELEKRSIQLSLEEAKELQCVTALNVLGKSLKNFKARADHHDCADN
ncbi:hypothetical protein L6164_037726 [Bauhinia variegata]|uniref:Uncharacterized protein n=1 Tax=Bauhinia variegata TaxID=167791 RepID=A0ACB9KKR0_BAUVA|nr:hypothetical protein L6164_037726 [Bauhinia variegata]